jgi:hypothetical protein
MLPHMAAAIDGADVSDTPFSHMFIKGIFPADIYSQMLKNLPDPSTYKAQDSKVLADGTPTRSFYQLDADGLSALPEHARDLWTGVVEAVRSDEYKSHIFHQLQKDLRWRFGVQDVNSIEAATRPRLVRDVSGYRIAPHPDTRKKVVTMMIYLPEDESQQSLGTSLYTHNLNPQGLFKKCKRFTEYKRFPFIPNSGFAFAVNNCLRKKSWHGRELVEQDAGVRNSLVTTFWVPDAVNFDY